MKILSLITLFLTVGVFSFGQPATQDPAFELAIQEELSLSIPTISVKDFKKMLKNEQVVILDAREQKEFDVSHISKAKHIGHNSLDKNALNGVDKGATIVVYCTVGVRAEAVGTRLQKMGYSNVYNLIGSIIEWTNQGNTIIDSNGNKTDKVHIYSPKYEKWLTSGLTAVK